MGARVRRGKQIINSQHDQCSWSRERGAVEIPEGSCSFHPVALAVVGGMEPGYALLLADSSCGAGFLGGAYLLGHHHLMPQELRVRRKAKLKCSAVVVPCATLVLQLLLPRAWLVLPFLPAKH